MNGFGLQLAPGQTSWSLTPTVRLVYAGFRQGSISETGAGGFNLRTHARTYHNALIRSGLETAKTWRLAGVPLRASGHADWIHDFTARSRPLKVRWEAQPNSHWSVRSTRGQPEMLGIGTALEIGLSDQRTIRLYAQHDFFSKASSTYLGFALNIAF
jgi:outer membrane autotransporter protein